MWRRGVHLLDVAGMAEGLPYPGSARQRADDEHHEWRPLATQLLIETVNQMRFLRHEAIQLAGVKPSDLPPSPDIIRPPDAEAVGDDTSERVGASEGFDSIDEMREWYLRNHPDMDGRV